jgi:hypothetical protein
MARPSLPPPGLNGHVYSLTQRVRFLGQNCQFSHFYRANGPINVVNVPLEQTAIGNYWLATIVPLIRPVLSVGTTIAELRIWCLTWPTVATAIASMGNPVGTFAGDPLPPQIALVLSKRTAFRGKSGRGRMFLCGMSEDGSTNGAPTVAQLNAANALAAVLKNSFTDLATGTTFDPVVVALQDYLFNSVTHPVPPAAPVPVPPPLLCRGGPITTIVSDVVWNTQRSRTFGKGE